MTRVQFDDLRLGVDKTVEINGMTPLHYLLHSLQNRPQLITVLKTMLTVGEEGKSNWVFFVQSSSSMIYG